MTPQRLGIYTILGTLGEGAHGVVYRARDDQGREVALKVLRELHEADGDLQRRFLRESALSTAIVHPNVVRAYAAGHLDGKPFLASELVPGGSVLELIERHGRLELDRALRIAADLFRGLDAIHRQGLVHRDIKPANLLLAGDGTAKIADLGLCRTTNVERTRFTADGAIVGTPAYVAPEQIERGDAIDIRADLYASGVLLYQCLSGQLPLSGKTILGILQAHLSEQPRPLHQVASVPSGVSQFVADLLAKDPARRPSDPAAALQRLASLQAASVQATVTDLPAEGLFPATLAEAPRPGVPLGMRPAPTVFPSTMPENGSAFPRTMPEGGAAFPSTMPDRAAPFAPTMPEGSAATVPAFPRTVPERAPVDATLSGDGRTIAPERPMAVRPPLSLNPASSGAPAALRLRSPSGSVLFCYAGPEVFLGRDAPRDNPRQICMRLFPAATMAERSMRISSRHASIRIGADGVHLRDLGSSHGTTVDGRPVPRQGDVPLADGALIRLSDVIALRVRLIPPTHDGATVADCGSVAPWPAVLLSREGNGDHHRYLIVSAPVALDLAPSLAVGSGQRILCGIGGGLWWADGDLARPAAGDLPSGWTDASRCASIHPDDHKG